MGMTERDASTHQDKIGSLVVTSLDEQEGENLVASVV